MASQTVLKTAGGKTLTGSTPVLSAIIEREMKYRRIMLLYANAHVIDTVAYLNCDDLK